MTISCDKKFPEDTATVYAGFARADENCRCKIFFQVRPCAFMARSHRYL